MAKKLIDQSKYQYNSYLSFIMQEKYRHVINTKKYRF